MSDETERVTCPFCKRPGRALTKDFRIRHHNNARGTLCEGTLLTVAEAAVAVDRDRSYGIRVRPWEVDR